MHRALIAGLAAVATAACGHGNEARTTTITGAPMITSGPAVGEPELPRTFRAASERIAGGVCRHEQRCGRGEAVPKCVDDTASRARSELMRWNCEPAAARARLEECLVGFDAQSCDAALHASSRPLCPPVLGCGDAEAKLIDPGPALARIWE